VIYFLSYLGDQFTNMLFGFGASGICILLSFLLIGVLSHGIPINGLYYEKFFGNWGYFFVVVIIWSIVAAYLAPSCGLILKGIASTLLAALLIVYWPKLNVSLIATDSRISALILIVSFIFLVAQLLGFGLLSSFWYFNKPSGLFTEPSHVAMYFLPIIAYRIFKNQFDLLALLLILFVFLFFNSATFLVGTVLLVFVILSKKFIHNPRKIQSSILIAGLTVCLIILIKLDVLNIDILTDRIYAIILAIPRDDPSGILNASAIVWLNGWSQAYDTLMVTNGMGLGFNQMGCGDFVNIGRFSEHIFLWAGGVLNWNDGSFLASKLIAEFGIIGIILVIYLASKSCLAIFAYLILPTELDSSMDNSYFIARASGGLCILVLLFIRANGYFLMPVILDISLLFYVVRQSKNQLKNAF